MRSFFCGLVAGLAVTLLVGVACAENTVPVHLQHLQKPIGGPQPLFDGRGRAVPHTVVLRQMPGRAVPLDRAVGGPPQVFHPTPARGDVRVDGSSGYNAGQLAALPTGQQRLFLSLCVADNWRADPRQVEVVNWLLRDGRLVALRQAMHFNFYRASQAAFRDRLMHRAGTAFPVLTVQRPSGELLAVIGPLEMPATAGELADLLLQRAAGAGPAPDSKLDRKVGGGASTLPDDGQVSKLDRKVEGGLDLKMDGSSRYNEGRVTDLPQGPGKLYCTLVVGDNWQSDPRQAALINWFDKDPRLARYKSETFFNSYTTGNPHFRDRLRNKVGDAVPMVSLLLPDGEVLLNVTAVSMPRSSGELADMIDDAVASRFSPPVFASGRTPIVRDCPDGNCPPNSPPNVAPVQPIPEVIPSTNSWSALVLVGLIAFAALGGLAMVLAVIVVVCVWRSWPASPPTVVHPE